MTSIPQLPPQNSQNSGKLSVYRFLDRQSNDPMFYILCACVRLLLLFFRRQESRKVAISIKILQMWRHPPTKETCEFSPSVILLLCAMRVPYIAVEPWGFPLFPNAARTCKSRLFILCTTVKRLKLQLTRVDWARRNAHNFPPLNEHWIFIIFFFFSKTCCIHMR